MFASLEKKKKKLKAQILEIRWSMKWRGVEVETECGRRVCAGLVVRSRLQNRKGLDLRLSFCLLSCQLIWIARGVNSLPLEAPFITHNKNKRCWKRHAKCETKLLFCFSGPGQSSSFLLLSRSLFFLPLGVWRGRGEG